MSTTHVEPHTVARTTRRRSRNRLQAPPSPPPGRVTLARVVRSELIKLRSVPSAVVTLTMAVVSIVAIGPFMSVGLIVQDPPAAQSDLATADPAGGSLTGVSLAAYLISALGVLMVTGEYSTGTIKTSLAAVPRRGMLVLGKALVLGLVTLVVTTASTLAAFFAAKAVLATADLSISLSQPGVLRMVLGSALYLSVVAVFSAAFGWLLRNLAGALAALFGVMVVLPVIGFILPQAIGQKILPYLPNNAGTAVMQLTPGGQLDPWTGLLIFIGYAVVALRAGSSVLSRRDA